VANGLIKYQWSVILCIFIIFTCCIHIPSKKK
jgi:hypothetical protein